MSKSKKIYKDPDIYDEDDYNDEISRMMIY